MSDRQNRQNQQNPFQGIESPSPSVIKGGYISTATGPAQPIIDTSAPWGTAVPSPSATPSPSASPSPSPAPQDD